MTSHNLLITAGAFALLHGTAVAQQVHQTAAAQPSATPLTSCAQVQPVVENIIAEAMGRLESARQTNDPAQLRAAVDHFGNALRDIRTQLALCAVPSAAADPHSGHAMPKPGPAADAGGTPTKPGAVADPHAGHQMPAAKPGPAPSSGTPAGSAKPKPRVTAEPHAGHQMPAAPKAAIAAKTTPPKPTAKASDPHAAYTETPPATKQLDPVNGLTVDPSTAPKTTHQGRTYYFSSEQSLKQFLENPAKFVKPGKK